jgi:hypothetical protein
MSLVYPSFLWALSALAIPIVIHLFNFRRTTRVYFSNTKFLKQVKEETTQKRRLKQYLVLASRLLFLFFLVMAFAQPFLPAKEEMGQQQTISIYIDNSYSMASPIAEKTRALEEAIRMAQSIVDLFPATTTFQLLTNDFAPASNALKARAEITDLLSQVKLSAISRNATEVLGRVKEKKSTLFWLSDFQKSTFGEVSEIDTSLQVRLVPVALENHPNIFVDSVYLENPFAIGGEKNTIRVRLHNSGNKNVEGLVTKLSINGLQAAATSTTISPNSFTEVPFDLVSGLKGKNKIIVSFNDFPISFDNQFFLTLNYSTKLNILEIKAGNQPSYIEKVFGNKDVFSFRSFNASNLNYSLFANTDLLVVNGIDRIDDALAGAINSYKPNLGSVLLIPGLSPDISSYQKLVSIPITKSTQSEMSELDKPDFQSPFFATVFEEKNLSIAMPRATATIEWGADRSAILKFKNNKPFLSQVENTFILSTPLEKSFTDFFNNALFVPVMYRIAASGKKSEQPLYYPLTSSTIIVPSDSLSNEEPVKLIGDQELIPSQHQINGKLFLELPKYAMSPGFYNVVNKSDTIGQIAFDLDKNESMLQQMTGEEAKAALGGRNNISIFKSNSAETFSTEIKERYLGKPLWKYAIVMSLIFLLAEVLLIRFLK